MPLKASAAGEAVDVITDGDMSAPVFVDTTGRRGRRIRFFFHAVGVAALAYAVLVVIAALLFTGPLELLSFPAPGQSPSATTPAKKNTPAPGQRGSTGSTGKRTTGGWSARSSPAPGAASASVGPSGSVTTAPPPETTTSAAPSASPSTAPTASTMPTTTQQPQPSAPQSSAPGVTVVVVVDPA